MKKSRVLSTAALALAVISGHASASVFIASHPDDIELLMNKNAASDVSGGYKTVIVLLTAGDASYGTGLGPNTKGIPYYRARMNAHEASIQFWQSYTPGTSPTAKVVPPIVRSIERLAGQNVEKATLGSVTLYYFNLPDNRLTDLDQYAVASLNSVTNTSTFSLATLRQAIREIIKITHTGQPTINVNYQDFEGVGDHIDHSATGRIVYWALNDSGTPGYTCTYQTLYQGYNTGNYSESFTDYEKKVHSATIGALNGALVSNGNPSTWDGFHINFIGKMVTRTVGGGTCNL